MMKLQAFSWCHTYSYSSHPSVVSRSRLRQNKISPLSSEKLSSPASVLWTGIWLVGECNHCSPSRLTTKNLKNSQTYKGINLSYPYILISMLLTWVYPVMCINTLTGVNESFVPVTWLFRQQYVVEYCVVGFTRGALCTDTKLYCG
jgi:hypothetical protein